jgi:hypothetical protein
MTERPLLKQFGDLTEQDFAGHPVWLNCHVADYEEPWYDETDEETFRPWSGGLPADLGSGMLLVRARAVLRDGSEHPAFLTPDPGGDLGQVQPQVFAGGRLFSFWGGVPGIAPEGRRAFYDAVGKGPDAVFPMRVAVEPGLVEGGDCAVEVQGFYRTQGRGKVEVER